MTLLNLLRPTYSFPRKEMSESEQNTLLTLATGVSDTDTVKMMAGYEHLSGPARERLLKDRNQSIRRRILARRDLTESELDQVLADENRTTVLSALAEKAEGDTLAKLVKIAEDRSSLTLAQALLSKATLSNDQRKKILYILIDNGRRFSQLNTYAIRALLPSATDPKVIGWAIDTCSGGARGRDWDVANLVRSAASATSGSEQLLPIVEAMAKLRAWSYIEVYLQNSLEHERKRISSSAASGMFKKEDLIKIAAELPDTLHKHGAPDALVDLSRTTTGNIMLLVGAQTAHADSTPEPEGRDLSAISLGEITTIGNETLSGLTNKDLVSLACNTNNTKETGWEIAREMRGRPGIAAEAFKKHEKIADEVWDGLRSHGQIAGSNAKAVLAAVGHDTLVAALTSPRLATNDDTWRYWRPSLPLIGHASALGWLVAEGTNEELDKVALALPTTEASRAEVEAFQLIHRTIGEDETLWDAINRLGGSWEGSFQELIETARAVA